MQYIHIVYQRIEYVNDISMNFSEFSKNLQKARELSGKTQLQVATLLGVREGAYQHYEYSRREPNLDRLRELARILNVSADFLLGLTDDPTPSLAKPEPQAKPKRAKEKK